MREVAGRWRVWYECGHCGSVLLWIGHDQWTYRKVGRKDRESLLKQPLTLDDLRALLEQPPARQAKEPLEEPALPTEPLAEPTLPIEPVQEPTLPTQPVREPALTSEPVQEPTLPTQPVREPALPAEPLEEPALAAAPVAETTVPHRGHAAAPAVPPERRPSPATKLLPWLFGLCVVAFLALLALAAFEALTRSSILARNTPTPAFPPGAEVRLVPQDGDSVTVWQVSAGCDVGNAFGQVPSGSQARTLDEACYRSRQKTTYHRIALANGASGWVEAGDIVPAAEYRPPPPTATPTPAGTPQPSPTVRPTQAPTRVPLPMGSALSAGNWGVRVDRLETAGSLSSPAGDKAVEATGRFALVFLTVTNHGTRPATLHASTIYIEDADGARYANDDRASAYASSAGCLDYALDTAPGESACLVAVLDISEQSRFYLLGLQGAGDTILLELP
jgi:hypothetical protein